MTLIERLYMYGETEGRGHYLPRKDAIEAAGVIEQQAARIAELEEEFERQRTAYGQQVGGLMDKLAALRRKIDEAPVVAWLYDGETYPVKQCSIVTDEEFPDQVALVKQEDLK